MKLRNIICFSIQGIIIKFNIYADKSYIKMARLFLEWTCKDVDYHDEDPELNAQYNIFVWWIPDNILEIAQDSVCFVLAGEPLSCVKKLENKKNIFCFSNNDCGERQDNNYFCPTFWVWGFNTENAFNKTKKCCAFESKREWRKEKILECGDIIKDIDFYGYLFNNGLKNGYHCFYDNNEKTTILKDYSFSIAIENSPSSDYITEKTFDITLTNGIPIFHGTENVYRYFIPESIILAKDIEKIDWKNWKTEYNNRIKHIAYQKELIRTKYNFFRYFIEIIFHPEMLNNKRPIQNEYLQQKTS